MLDPIFPWWQRSVLGKYYQLKKRKKRREGREDREGQGEGKAALGSAGMKLAIP